MRESDSVFSIIESVHVLGLTLMVGTIALLDLRILGILLPDESIGAILGAIVPLSWIGFALMACSGLLLFWAEAAKLYGNPAFRCKLLLLAVAGLNQLFFQRTAYRTVGDWGTTRVTPPTARMAAALSLACWGAVIVCGRAIAYFS
jgi:hypothetical protein